MQFRSLEGHACKVYLKQQSSIEEVLPDIDNKAIYCSLTPQSMFYRSDSAEWCNMYMIIEEH